VDEGRGILGAGPVAWCDERIAGGRPACAGDARRSDDRDRGSAYGEDKHEAQDNRQRDRDKTDGRDNAQDRRGARETDRGDRDKNDYPSSSRPTQYPNSPDYQNNSGVN